MKSLEASSVAVRRGGRSILEHIDLQLGPGDLLAIVGPNGSGKSTLLRALAGIWPVSGGSVRINQRSISSLSRREIARRIAFLPQDARLDFAFTATFLASLLGMWRGRGDLVPWIVGALAAILTSRLIEGNWYIIVGGLVGSFAGALAETIKVRRHVA